MFSAQVFKKVRREVGLSPNAWVVQGGAMHWQKMGWRRGGSASLHKVLENWWKKELNMSLMISSTLWTTCWTRKNWDWATPACPLPSLFAVFSWPLLIMPSCHIQQTAAGFGSLPSPPPQSSHCSWTAARAAAGHTIPRGWMKTLPSIKTINQGYNMI